MMHVDLSITRQPESYQSVRAAVSLPVFVRPGDDLEALIAETLDQARAQIHEEINREFEGHNYAAPYGDDPRYRLVRIPDEKKLFAILPADIPLEDMPNGWDMAEEREFQNHRLPKLRQLLKKYKPSGVWDCSEEHDVDELPQLERVILWRNDNHEFYLLTTGDDWPSVNLPAEIVTKYGYFRSSRYIARQENMQSIINEHRKDGYALFDCRDGDFSRLPEPKKEEVSSLPELPFEDDEDPDDYDDYEDEEDYN